MKKYKSKPWTEQENELLQEYYHNLSLNALFAILPGRSRRDIDAQAHYLKTRNRRFS